ncbi:MAG TPA: secretin N-terminal domain-containing protein, partial [Sedimentisphaerales bacterium]|nr:secretin N-terminal domain-containing protein [Sedimentisphaerales bacterium]
SGLGEPNGPMEFVNLKSVEMKSIIEKLAAWTGKVIIPTDTAMQQRVTIYAPEKLPRSRAIGVIYSALRLKGYIATETDGEIFLEPITDAKLGRIPTIAAGEPLALIDNKEQIVQKFFQMTSYSPSEMGTIIQPLIGEHGYVSVDEASRTLMVIDTVGNLMRLERIIEQFDVPGAEQAVTDIVEVRFGDPSEIVQMLNILLGETQGRSTRASSSNRGPFGFGGRPDSSSPRPPSSSSSSSSSSSAKRPDSKTGTATSVVVGTTRGPIVLLPEPRRKWIIVKASAEDMKLIQEWVTKLDREEPVEAEYEVVQLRYADPREVENSIGDGFRDLPGTEFLPSILVQPLTQTKQVIIFGRKDLREIVKKMIAEVDVPPGQFETVHIKLIYADPDMVKEKLDALYQEGMSSRSSSYGGYYGGYSSSSRGGSSSRSSDMVKVVTYPSLKEITVIASPENIGEIKKRIAEWDVPLDVDAVKPRIIELRNMDPVQMANLLNTLFSESGGSSTNRSVSILRSMFGSQMADQQKIVGALYGQLTFQEVPGTKKIIVISKIPEAYAVIETLVAELDKEEMAEVPIVVTLKYADPELLSEILNAMFAEAGTSATLRRGATGLSEYSMEDTGTSSSSSQTSTSQQNYTPWWSGSGARRTVDTEMPISNVIGRIRFVPDPRTKSILVLSPPEYVSEIQKLIATLDIPGKQVMVKAIIVEVNLKNLSSLGVQLATNPSAFGTLDENSITALSALSQLDRHGSLVFGAGGNQGTQVTNTLTADVSVLIDFLAKKVNAKVLNQQTLWTKDNEEASFFKGDKVAFFTSASTSATAGNVQNFEFQRVGMTLAVRPSITPNNDVDMIINIIISQLTTEEQNSQPVRTEMETKTNMIVGDSQTLMLGGILFQQDSVTNRKVPLLGDIPLLGALFSHNETTATNNEMLVFITPYVIDEPDKTGSATKEEIQRSKERLDNIREGLNETMEGFTNK